MEPFNRASIILSTTIKNLYRLTAVKFSTSSTSVRATPGGNSSILAKLKDIVKPFTLILLSCFIFSCDSYEVKQIAVDVPSGVQVPEEMVYIPAGEFIMGHKEEPRTRLGETVVSDAYLIDRYEVSREQYKKFQPQQTFSPKSALHPVTHISY